MKQKTYISQVLIFLTEIENVLTSVYVNNLAIQIIYKQVVSLQLEIRKSQRLFIRQNKHWMKAIEKSKMKEDFLKKCLMESIL